MFLFKKKSSFQLFNFLTQKQSFISNKNVIKSKNFFLSEKKNTGFKITLAK